LLVAQGDREMDLTVHGMGTYSRCGDPGNRVKAWESVKPVVIRTRVTRKRAAADNGREAKRPRERRAIFARGRL